MKSNMSIILLLTIIFSCNVLATTLSSPVYYVRDDSQTKLETALLRYLDVYHSHGNKDADNFAVTHNIHVKDNRVLVELDIRQGRLTDEISASTLTKFNIEINCKSEHFICVWVPINLLDKFANDLAIVSKVHRPYKLVSNVTSEGVGLIGADEFHDEDITGEDVKVAILDLGFNGMEDAQDEDELPERLTVRNFTEEDMDEGSVHGTACAEIVFDLAPDADFYLTKIFHSAHFENAVDYLIEQQVDIISHSCGWTVAMVDYFRGGDPLSEKVSDAFEQGIFFVNSAGNHAKCHYRAEFDDNRRNDNYHRFTGDISVNHFGITADRFTNIRRGESIRASLQWDDFPQSGEDYNLYLVYKDEDDDEWAVVDRSEDVQNGNDPPTEQISYIAEQEGNYGVSVHNRNGDDGIDFTIITSHDLAFRTRAGSILIPAIGEDNFAVGAINYRSWERDNPSPEGFSSRGPTYDGRIKPDICGPDGTASFIYDGAFYGTSSACPHVAGAAVLIKSVDPDAIDNEDLWEYLTEHARDVGAEGQDNNFGYGLVSIELDFEPGNRVISVPNDFETITEAIEDAIDGDTILVAPGEYEENIDFSGKNIVIASTFIIENDEEVISETIIDGGDDGGVVTFTSGESEDAQLIGFTITNGNHNHGGGIYLTGESCPVISYCYIINNQAGSNGGGIAIWNDANPIIDRCLISGNTSVYGGGIFCANANPTIVNCTITGNEADEHAGAILLYNGAETTIQNSILWYNDPQGITFFAENNAVILTISYSDIEGGRDGIVTFNNGRINWGEGNINSDPRFADAGNDDYHLTENSPCIDSGDPDSPQDPDETRADMGAFYFPHYVGDPAIEVVWSEEYGYPVNVDWNGAFDEILTGFSYDIDLTINNTGGEDLVINEIDFEGDNFSIEPDNFTVEARQSQDITITFSADDPGEYEATMTIVSNDPDNEEYPVDLIAVIVNHPPEARNEIPNQELHEDFERFVVADLDNVFYDLDDDELTFEAESNNAGLIVEIDENNCLWLEGIENWFGLADVTVIADDSIDGGRDLGPVRSINSGRLDIPVRQLESRKILPQSAQRTQRYYSFAISAVENPSRDLTTEISFDVTVFQVNDPPRWNDIPPEMEVDEGRTIEFTLTAEDVDQDDQLYIEFLDDDGVQDRGATLDDNFDGSAEFTWMPDDDDEGVYEPLFGVVDEANGADMVSVRITVNNVSRIPASDNDSPIPTKLALGPIYPNPFNNVVTIGFDLPMTVDILLTIHDPQGRLINIVERGNLSAGRYHKQWEGNIANGIQAPSGIYICRLVAGDHILMQRLVMIK
ncbi:MAG: S8 family serine peptidase [Candidatus Hatepunaea meridiana]|nr:S8 family serine peptidase [Candidatus Hatepunaea meridiana]